MPLNGALDGFSLHSIVFAACIFDFDHQVYCCILYPQLRFIRSLTTPGTLRPLIPVPRLATDQDVSELGFTTSLITQHTST